MFGAAEFQQTPLELNPSTELVFKGPFSDVVTSYLHLLNPTNDTILFRIKTTAPRQYCVRPNIGVLCPQEESTISVMLQPFDHDSNPAVARMHKFMVLTMFAPPNFRQDQFDIVWRSAPRSKFMGSKLCCVFVEPAPDQDSTQVAPDTQERIDVEKETTESKLRKFKDKVNKLYSDNTQLKSETSNLRQRMQMTSLITWDMPDMGRRENEKPITELQQIVQRAEREQKQAQQLMQEQQDTDGRKEEIETMKRAVWIAEREKEQAQREREVVQRREREEREIAEREREQAHLNRRRAEEAEAEARELKTQWVVKRKEIQLTNVELGRGGWGEVKVANFRGIQVAAKCLYKDLTSSYYQDMFSREMNMAARLRHPNLVQFIGASIEGHPIILTELMKTSLRVELENKTIKQHQVKSISLDVARALNYLHLMQPHPIIHRDVSSANVLLDPLPDNQWKAKVTDYGSVNLQQKLHTVGPGSPVYSAPEASTPALQSPKMDIFSFGVLLVEMLTSRFPEVSSRQRLIASIDHVGYQRLIQQCLSEERDQRPSAEQLLATLNGF